MTDEVAEMVLEDNRLQALALSIAESGGVAALPGQVRTIELLEASGRLDRKVEGLTSSEELLRRAQEQRGLTRPELAVVLSMSKMALQDAAARHGAGALLALGVLGLVQPAQLVEQLVGPQAGSTSWTCT